MTPEFLNFILALSMIILFAKVGGYVSVRLKQPSVLGELLVGVILGPTLLDIFHVASIFAGDKHLGESITLMAELGVLMLMMLAGLELHLAELLKSSKVAVFAGVLGVIVPLGLGWITARMLGATSDEALFVGLTLSATSVSISAQTLMEMGVLQSRVGLGLLGAAVLDDMLVILVLSISLLLVGDGGGGALSILFTVLRMGGYLLVASLIGTRVLPWLLRQVDRLPISQGALAFTVVAALFYAWAAEALGGMAAITGSFLVGLFLARTPYKHKVTTGVVAMAYSLFVPVFFVNIGLTVDMGDIIGPALGFALVITLVAIVGKLLGSGVGAYWGGFSRRESWQLGIGMISRGEVGLIVASFAQAEGILTGEYFSAMVFMVIVATLLTPPLLRASFAKPQAVA